MRIISYNILDGGEGRADPLAEIIQAQRADVVALVEADNIDVVERIAKRLNMEYIHARGKRHGSALLARWPIVESVNHGAITPGLDDSFLEATVLAPGGVEWPVGVVHLHAHATEEDERIREGEIDEILKLMSVHRQSGRAHVLAGDFNANSPIQQIDPARCKPRTQKDWQQNGGHLPRRAIQKLLDAGYADSLAVAHPETASASGTFSTQFSGQRVDYVFTFGTAAGQVREAWIEQDRLARYASDHYLIGLEIEA